MDTALEKRLQLIEEYTILECIHGSKAYGTSIPTSDTDKRGICIIPDPRLFFGMQRFEQQDGGWPEDKTVHHLPKFMSLASTCNPNLLEILWVDDRDILKITPLGEKLRQNKHLFLSKKAKHSFTGYAVSQLGRMRGHKEWMDEHPTEPEIKNFTHRKVVVSGPLGTKLSESAKIIAITPQEEAGWFNLEIETFDEMGYEAAVENYKNFIGWQKNRNQIRAALEANHGFDTKHASHLIRLLRMGKEILLEQKVYVKRPDAEELLAIRNGAWSYDQILDYAEAFKKELDEAEKKSKLPDEVDRVAVERLQIELIEEVFESNKGKSIHF